MQESPKGTPVRVIMETEGYNLKTRYRVHVLDDDGTCKLIDPDGRVGNWIRWSALAPQTPGVGWDFLKKVLPPDVVRLLSSFDGIERLELSLQVKDRILLADDHLHDLILRHAEDET